MTEASATHAARPSTVITPCPRCGELGESDAHEANLTCPECEYTWTHPPPRTADETIALVRGLLKGEQDATRRNFYNGRQLLREIASVIDAYPDPPLPTELVFCLRLEWGSVGPGGFPSTSHGWHMTSDRTIWRGALKDAADIVRKEYPPHNGVSATLVLANAKELVR